MKLSYFRNASVQCQMKIRKISRRHSRSLKYAKLSHFPLFMCWRRQRNLQRFITHVNSYSSAHWTYCVVAFSSSCFWFSYRPRPYVCGYFWIPNFFFLDIASITRIRRIRQLNRILCPPTETNMEDRASIGHAFKTWRLLGTRVGYHRMRVDRRISICYVWRGKFVNP